MPKLSSLLFTAALISSVALAHESMAQTSPDVIGKMAARAGVKTVVLTHLTAKSDDDYTPWVNEVKKYFPGQVLAARDLMEF